MLVSFAAVTLSYATPAPASAKAVGAKKTVTTNPLAKEKQKTVKGKKKTTAVTQKYKVRAGDSLSTIARRHGMKLAELQRRNGLKSSHLKIGQILIVSSKTKKSGKTQANEIVKESGQLISRIALPNAEGRFDDSLTEVGVEPIARTYLAIPYRYGAESRNSTDCSGFVQQVFREFDIKLPRTAREQYTIGMKIDRTSLSSGDLLFFRTRAKKKYPTHVGIYLGNGKMIHASSRQRKVVISDVNHPYYVKRYVGAKRTATFLPGEIDLEMLARQVTGTDIDAPLTAAITTDVGEESDAMSELASLTMAAATQGLILEAGYDDRGDEADDIDDDVEPEPEAIIPAQPRLGTFSQPEEVEAEGIATETDYSSTAVTTSLQVKR